MHFKKDVGKMEKKIINIEKRTAKEEKLFQEKDRYKDIHSTKEYMNLFVDGNKHSYSEAMGLFQQEIQTLAKEANCNVINTQWQEMPVGKDRWYGVLSLRVSLTCTPQSFMLFQNQSRANTTLFTFNRLTLSKHKKNDFLQISTTIYAYRSNPDEK